MSVVYAKFPVANGMLLVEDEVEIPIQINGKVKSKIKVDSNVLMSITRNGAC